MYKNNFYVKIHISVVSQNFSEISSSVKKWEGGQKYMGKTKIRDVIDSHLLLNKLEFKNQDKLLEKYLVTVNPIFSSTYK